MSRSANKAGQATSWKQEVNERVAAHLSRKSQMANAAPQPTEVHPTPEGRAAQAAARVAARYANAPSFNEALAGEARAAMRAAQAASRAAQEAHDAAQIVLDGLEAAAAEDASWQPADAPEQLRGRSQIAFAPPSRLLFDDEPPPTQDSEPTALAESSEHRADSIADSDLSFDFRPAIFETGLEELLATASSAQAHPSFAVDRSTFADLPIHANLIQFPREVIATRKVRPRRIEGPLATSESESQLSIFEVDPGAISIQPTAPQVDEPAAPTWMHPEWPALDLDVPAELDGQSTHVYYEREEPEIAPASQFNLLHAPLNRRIIAIAVDSALIMGSYVALAQFAMHHISHFPSLHAFMIISAIVVLVLCAAYETLFHGAAEATPGMIYAGIALSTLSDEAPSRRQRLRRLAVLPLSVLPLGLGLAWALFDESQLTWHDRLSGTYLRKL